MKKVFKLSEIDCPVCAGKLEKKIAKIDGVKECNINFLLLKLIVEIDEKNEENIVKEIEKVVKKFDSNILLKEV